MACGHAHSYEEKKMLGEECVPVLQSGLCAHVVMCTITNLVERANGRSALLLFFRFGSPKDTAILVLNI